MEPLLLISEKLNAIQKSINDGIDLKKGSGSRDGLIQQIITYVRDGKTVVRKQWVRSEFADHARKNQEERKKTLLKEQEREDVKRKRDLQEHNEKQHNQDKREAKKVETRKEEELGHHKPHLNDLEAYKKKMKEKHKKEEKERNKQQDKSKDKDKKKDKHSAYGGQNATRADNKAVENIATNYTPPSNK